MCFGMVVCVVKSIELVCGVCIGKTTAPRAVWEIHECNDSIRARGRSPRALIGSLHECVSHTAHLELWFNIFVAWNDSFE